MSQENKINLGEIEKLKELIGTVKNLEAASEEAIKGGGTKIEDSMLDRAKRAVDSYTKYLSARYSEPAESFITNLEASEKAAIVAKEKAAEDTKKAAEKPVVEDKEKSPSNVENL
jgi:hypothetical protein